MRAADFWGAFTGVPDLPQLSASDDEQRRNGSEPGRRESSDPDARRQEIGSSRKQTAGKRGSRRRPGACASSNGAGPGGRFHHTDSRLSASDRGATDSRHGPHLRGCIGSFTPTCRAVPFNAGCFGTRSAGDGAASAIANGRERPSTDPAYEAGRPRIVNS